MTISLRLNDDLEAALNDAAAASGVSRSEFVRRCLQERLAGDAATPSAWEIGKHLFGKHHSGQKNLAREAKRVARAKIHGRQSNR